MLFDKLTRLTDAEKARLFDEIVAVLSQPYSLFSEDRKLILQSSGCSSVDNNINNINNTIQNTSTTTTTLQNYEVCQEWIRTFAEICKSYPKPARLTERRRVAILARIQEDSFSLDDFRAACRNMEKSDWIKSRGFGSFDWIIANADNLAKLAEGYYNRKDGKTADQAKPAELPPLTGRAALLEKHIRETAAHLGKTDVDARALAVSLKATMDADRYYSQLDDIDLERIFHNGKARKYEYYGQITPALFCEWFNKYKDDWLERCRRAKMVR